MKRVSFEKVYLLLALMYSCAFPIYMMLSFKLGYQHSILQNLNYSILAIAILVLLVFLVDTIINKNNIFKFIRSNKSIIVLTIGFIFLTISSLRADDVHLAIFGTSYRFGGLLSFFFYGVLAILGYKLTPNHRNIFFRTLIYMLTLISLLSLINNDFTKQFLFIEHAGIYTNINHFSTVLSYALIINIFTIYNDKGKLITAFDFICFIILIGMLIINTSFACYLTTMMIILFTIVYAIKNKKILKFLLMSSVFIIISVTGAWALVKGNFEELLEDLGFLKTYQEEALGKDEDTKEYYFESIIRYIGSYRGELWTYGIEMIEDKPILGYGPENFSDDYYTYPLSSSENLPHNLILFLWLSGGIFTLLAYIIANLIILWKNRKCFYQNNLNTVIWFSIIGHLMQSMFNNTLFYTTSLYAILFGMIYKETKKDN